MKTQGTIDLFLYWNRIRGTMASPPRAKVEPSDIRTILPHTFILQNDDKAQISFRLAGTRLCATMGHELRGERFYRLFEPRDHHLIGKLVENCRRDKLVVSLGMIGQTKTDRRIDFDMVLLPLAQEHGSGLILGCLQSESFGQGLGHDPIVHFRTQSLRIIDPNCENAFLKNRISMQVPDLVPRASDPIQLREADAASTIKPRGPIKLRVIEGGKQD